jgi:hypothetical protein
MRSQFYANGIPESSRIDQSRHSLFGASKIAADIMVEEYEARFWNADLELQLGWVSDKPSKA